MPSCSVRKLLQPRRRWIDRLLRRPAPTPVFWKAVETASSPTIITSRAIRENYAKAIEVMMGRRNDDLERDLVYAPGWRSAIAWLERRESEREATAAAAAEWPWPTRSDQEDNPHA